MSIELTMLALSVALLFVLILIQAAAGTQAQGLMTMANARDNLGPASVWQARTKRCVDNHREGLILFAPLVLIAAHQGISTSLTVLGAQLFFYSRVAHAVVYLAGLPYIRPIFWGIGIVGTIMIFLALFNIGA
ncbi:MAG: MAPEG family protein [Alphaproteobacteria bacterium]|nr:MAPEG family protein [Alphaproteobacteria bacterium]